MIAKVDSFKTKYPDFEYFKRAGNTFYFRSGSLVIDATLKGKELFDFVDKHDLGDLFKL